MEDFPKNKEQISKEVDNIPPKNEFSIYNQLTCENNLHVLTNETSTRTNCGCPNSKSNEIFKN